MNIIRVDTKSKSAFCCFLEENNVPYTIFSVSIGWTQYCVKADKDILLVIGLTFPCRVYTRSQFIQENAWAKDAKDILDRA